MIAYHVVQEGLTNVRRHAPGAPVSLQVDANPPQGVHVHVSNPTMPQSPSHMADTRKGAGLPGLAKRIQRLAEHANTVLTNITSSTLMYDYHGLGEHRTQP